MSGATGRVCRALTIEIASARHVPGAALPTDNQLASRLNVTAEAVHTAIERLEAWGFVSIAADGIATVNPETRWGVLDPEVVAALLESEQGPAIVAEYLEARRALETIAAGLAAQRATVEDLTALSSAFARMTAVDGSDDEFHTADVEFHRALVDASHNRPLRAAADPLQPALCVARRPLARAGLRGERELPEHQRILAAVARGDAETARRAMTEHLDAVESYLREYVGLAGCGSDTRAEPDER